MGLPLSHSTGSMSNRFMLGLFGLYCADSLVPMGVFLCIKSRVSCSVEKAGPTHSPE